MEIPRFSVSTVRSHRQWRRWTRKLHDRCSFALTRENVEQPRREINLHVYRPAEDYRRRKRIEGEARVGSRFLETRLWSRIEHFALCPPPSAIDGCVESIPTILSINVISVFPDKHLPDIWSNNARVAIMIEECAKRRWIKFVPPRFPFLSWLRSLERSDDNGKTREKEFPSLRSSWKFKERTIYKERKNQKRKKRVDTWRIRGEESEWTAYSKFQKEQRNNVHPSRGILREQIAT